MKTAKSIIVVLFVLLTAQIASAYYCPSTGRWLSRDPIGEPGFQTVQLTAQTSITPSAPGRWSSRDPKEEPPFKLPRRQQNHILGDISNPCTFVLNNPLLKVDPYGLTPITPETDIDDCLYNALDSRTQTFLGAFGKSCGHHIWGNIILGGGTAISGCFAIGCCKGANLIADTVFLCFSAGEVVEVTVTGREDVKIKKDAQDKFVVDCKQCGDKYKDAATADQYITDHSVDGTKK